MDCEQPLNPSIPQLQSLNQTTMPDDSAQPYLDTTPPHWVARGWRDVIIAAFGLVVLGAVLVQGAGDRCSGPLHPGADPRHRPGAGGEERGAGGGARRRRRQRNPRLDPIPLLRSASMSDRAADRLTLESQLRANEQRLTILKSQYDTRRRSDEAEGRRLAESDPVSRG